MPAIFDLLYREFCRARLDEMRKQLLILPARHAVSEVVCDAKDAIGAGSSSEVGDGETAPTAPQIPRLGEDQEPK
jgi:hypothetical protein